MTIKEDEAARLIARDEMTVRAEDIKARILAGETVPLEELRGFILHVNLSCQERKREPSKEKAPQKTPPKDVDFF